MNIAIISGSVRQGNVTQRVAAWVEHAAKAALPEAEINVINLGELLSLIHI